MRKREIENFQFQADLKAFRGAGGIPVDYGEAGNPMPGQNVSNGALASIFVDFQLFLAPPFCAYCSSFGP